MKGILDKSFLLIIENMVNINDILQRKLKGLIKFQFNLKFRNFYCDEIDMCCLLVIIFRKFWLEEIISYILVVNFWIFFFEVIVMFWCFLIEVYVCFVVVLFVFQIGVWCRVGVVFVVFVIDFFFILRIQIGIFNVVIVFLGINYKEKNQFLSYCSLKILQIIFFIKIFLKNDKIKV